MIIVEDMLLELGDLRESHSGGDVFTAGKNQTKLFHGAHMCGGYHSSVGLRNRF